MVGCVLRPIDSEVIQRRHPHLLSLAKDVKLGFYTVPSGNQTPGRHVAVHYTTAAPCQPHQLFITAKRVMICSNGLMGMKVLGAIHKAFLQIFSSSEHNEKKFFQLSVFSKITLLTICIDSCLTCFKYSVCIK